MPKTMSHRRHRVRVAAGSWGLGLLVLTGCSGTVDGSASAGQDVIGSIGSAPTTAAASESTATSESSSESAASSASGETPSDAPQTPTGSSSAAGTTTGSSVSSTTASPSTTTPSSAVPSPSTSTTAGTTAPGDPTGAGLTAPGTQLAYGAPAVLPFAYAEAQGVFTLSGLTVTRGSEADWTALGVDTADAQGEEPWYVRLTVKQESGGDFSFLGLQDNIWAYTADDDGIDVVYPQDDANPICPTTVAPADFTVGQSYDACVVLAVNLGESVDRVQYEGGYEADDPYYESPVVWKG